MTMAKPIPAVTPPHPGLEKEEPEIAQEDDIPADDGGPAQADEGGGREQRPLRDVERE
jgi:hypothetical protein